MHYFTLFFVETKFQNLLCKLLWCFLHWDQKVECKYFKIKQKLHLC